MDSEGKPCPTGCASQVDSSFVERAGFDGPREKDVVSKARWFMESLRLKTPKLGAAVEIDPSMDYPLAFAGDQDVLEYKVEYVHESGWIMRPDRTSVRITPKGWQYLNELQPDSETAFVALWFDDEMRAAQMELEQGIRDAGYEPVVSNSAEFTGPIMDMVLSSIRTCRFVVVDYTGQRHGVYYEAGFAEGLGKTVISCCRNSDIEKQHFDQAQFNHIAWHEPGDIREWLVNTIIRLVGRGPKSVEAQER